MEATQTVAAYDLEGSLLEVCDCDILCPCWIGEDPDNGECHSFLAYHFDQGEIRGVDVSGLTLVLAAHIPGNVLAGNFKTAFFVDDNASDEQADAIIAAFRGELGGPLADLAALTGEVLGIERAPIEHEIKDGAGSLRVGDFIEATTTPYTGPDGSTTTLNNSIFSTVPGSPAYVAKTEHQRISLPQHGLEWEIEGRRNAIQSDWKIRHEA